MMNLAEYRNSNSRLADFLPWAALVGSGVVLNKDGSFQRTARFRGPDLDSAVAAELVAVAGRLNNAFRRLGSGWAIFVEAQRHPATYPDSHFPDAASALVDAERKADFEEAGAHFESSYFLTFTYLPPAEDAARAEAGSTRAANRRRRSARGAGGFTDRTDRLLRLIEAFMPECRWLDDGETLTYLHASRRTGIASASRNADVSRRAARRSAADRRAGAAPWAAHLRVLTITGFPTATTPGLLDELNRLAFPIAGARARSCSTRPTRPSC
jgi:type IV secretion system protein VirB4